MRRAPNEAAHQSQLSNILARSYRAFAQYGKSNFTGVREVNNPLIDYWRCSIEQHLLVGLLRNRSRSVNSGADWPG